MIRFRASPEKLHEFPTRRFDFTIDEKIRNAAHNQEQKQCVVYTIWQTTKRIKHHYFPFLLPLHNGQKHTDCNQLFCVRQHVAHLAHRKTKSTICSIFCLNYRLNTNTQTQTHWVGNRFFSGTCPTPRTTERGAVAMEPSTIPNSIFVPPAGYTLLREPLRNAREAQINYCYSFGGGKSTDGSIYCCSQIRLETSLSLSPLLQPPLL